MFIFIAAIIILCLLVLFGDYLNEKRARRTIIEHEKEMAIKMEKISKKWSFKNLYQ